jgi:hypothetical protein
MRKNECHAFTIHLTENNHRRGPALGPIPAPVAVAEGVAEGVVEGGRGVVVLGPGPSPRAVVPSPGCPRRGATTRPFRRTHPGQPPRRSRITTPGLFLGTKQTFTPRECERKNVPASPYTQRGATGGGATAGGAERSSGRSRRDPPPVHLQDDDGVAFRHPLTHPRKREVRSWCIRPTCSQPQPLSDRARPCRKPIDSDRRPTSTFRRPHM